MKRPSVFLCAFLFLGCGSKINVQPMAPGDIEKMEQLGNFPERSYRIEPGDALQVRYTFHPEMNQEVLVRPDGKAALTLVGELSVADLKTSELEKKLVELTSHRLKDPEVVVTVTKFSEKHVYIGGEVGRPGMIPYRKGLTPLQAVIAAGGFNDTARGDSVILVRIGGPDNETVLSRKLNLLEETTRGMSAKLYLAPHDVLYIPKTRIAEADLWVRQHISDLLPFLRAPSYRVQ
jgi:protein involved in polysaccharide export with SLBB domain